MNPDSARLKDKIKKTWGRLSDSEIALYYGNRQEFYGKLREKYGIARAETQKTLAFFEAACRKSDNHAA